MRINKKVIVDISIALLTTTLLAVLLIFLFKPKSYTMKVKSIEWAYVVGVQKLEKVHHSGWSNPPSGAYNVESYKKTRGTDENGADTYDIWYEYDLDEWVHSRNVTTHGNDKEPYFGDYILKVTDDKRGLGNERVSNHIKTYTIGGTDVKTDEFYIIDISEDIWSALEIGDELNFKKNRVGVISEVRLAE